MKSASLIYFSVSAIILGPSPLRQARAWASDESAQQAGVLTDASEDGGERGNPRSAPSAEPGAARRELPRGLTEDLAGCPPLVAPTPRFLTPAPGAILDNGRQDRSDGITWEFRWSGVPGATRYHLHVLHAGASIPLVDRTDLTSTSFLKDDPGSYIINPNAPDWRWKVRALVDGTWGAWSEERIFDVEPLDTDGPGARGVAPVGAPVPLPRDRFSIPGIRDAAPVVAPPGPELEGLDDPSSIADLRGPVLIRSLRGHSAYVSSLAFSPDRFTLISGGGDKTLRVWDLAAGRERATLRGHADPVACVAIAPDEQTLASGDQGGSIRLWDMPAGRARTELEGQDRARNRTAVHALAFSPDGTILASADHGGVIRLWEFATGKLRQEIRGGEGPVWDLAFTDQGRTIVAGLFTTVMKRWDVATNRILEGGRAWHTSDQATVATDIPRLILARTIGRSPSITVWHAPTGRQLASLTGHAGGIHALAFSPDGRYLASGGGDKAIRLWDLAVARRAWIQARERERLRGRDRSDREDAK